MTPDKMHAHLSELARTIPEFGSNVVRFQPSEGDLIWYGRLHAILDLDKIRIDALQLQVAWNNLGTLAAERAVNQIKSILYAALQRAELTLPLDATGAFIPAGNHFDALAAIGKIL